METLKRFMDKINANKKYFSLRFFVTSVILTIVFFLLSVDIFKTYTSSITILVNAKSEIAADNQKQIIGNIIEFPKTLAFYDQFLKYNPDVRDMAAGRSSWQRKQLWNSMLSIKRVGKETSLIKISITANQKSDADQLVQKTTRSIFAVTGAYYNIKNDLDLRIINGPVSRSAVEAWPLLLTLSVVLGFSIVFLLQSVLSKNKPVFAYTNYIAKGKSFFDFNKLVSAKTVDSDQAEIKSLEDLYAAEQTVAIFPTVSNQQKITPEAEPKTDDSKMLEMKKLTKLMEPGKYPNFPEMPLHDVKKTSAPDNLPVADDFFFVQSNLNMEQPAQSNKEEELPPTATHQEPTPDQLRERLNKLLRGEL